MHEEEAEMGKREAEDEGGGKNNKEGENTFFLFLFFLFLISFRNSATIKQIEFQVIKNI